MSAVNGRISIRLRLSELMDEKGVTPEELATASGLSQERIDAYCAGTLDAVSLGELGQLLQALGCARITDILEEQITAVEGGADDAPPVRESEWDSPCRVSPDGKHRWYKDLAVSDTLYQEFVCRACGRKLSVIH